MFALLRTPLLILLPFLTFAMALYFNVLLAHTLNIGEYGDFIIGLKTFTIVSTCLLLGTATAAKRFLAGYINDKDDSSSLAYIRWCLQLIIDYGAYFVFILVLLLIGMITFHIFQLKDIRTYHITFYLLFLTPLGALALLFSSFLQCNKNIILFNLFTQGGQPLLYIVLIGISTYFFHPVFNNRLMWLLTLLVFTGLVVIEGSLVYFFFPKGLLDKLVHFKKIVQPTVLMLWQKTARRFILNQLVFLIACATDLYAVKFFMHSKLAVDQYTAILSISSLLFLIGTIELSFITPNISSYLAQKDSDKLQKLINRGNIINLCVSTLVMLLMIFLGRKLLAIFGAQYVSHESDIALIIVVVGYYFGTFSCASTMLLSYSGNEIWLVYGSIAELFTIIVSAIVLTVLYGIIGAAIASALTTILQTVAYTWIASKKTPIKPLAFI